MIKIDKVPQPRIRLIPDQTPAFELPKVEAKELFELLRPEMASLPQEHIVVVCLSANRLLGAFTVAQGAGNSVHTSMKDIFAGAILLQATSLIVVHNHPSGDCMPSRPDIEAAQVRYKASEIMGIKIPFEMVICDRSFALIDGKLPIARLDFYGRRWND